jgi:hypothetical protein
MIEAGGPSTTSTDMIEPGPSLRSLRAEAGMMTLPRESRITTTGGDKLPPPGGISRAAYISVGAERCAMTDYYYLFLGQPAALSAALVESLTLPSLQVDDQGTMYRRARLYSSDAIQPAVNDALDGGWGVVLLLYASLNPGTHS